MIYMRLDQIMLAKMRSDTEVGIFAAALRFLEIWYFIPMALSSSLLPSLIGKQKADPLGYETTIGHFYDINAGLAYALIAVLVPTAPWLFNLVYGEGFAGAESVFHIQIWAALFVFLGVARSSYLINRGLTGFDLFATTIGVLLNVVLNLFLIPKHGAQGAAVATVISQMVSAFVTSFMWAPTRANGRLQLRALLLPWRALTWTVRWASDRREVPGRKEIAWISTSGCVYQMETCISRRIATERRHQTLARSATDRRQRIEVPSFYLPIAFLFGSFYSVTIPFVGNILVGELLLLIVLLHAALALASTRVLPAPLPSPRILTFLVIGQLVAFSSYIVSDLWLESVPLDSGTRVGSHDVFASGYCGASAIVRCRQPPIRAYSHRARLFMVVSTGRTTAV